MLCTTSNGMTNSAKKQKAFQAPKGMHDILPEDQKYWKYIMKKAEPLLEFYNFERIDMPLVESTDLFSKSEGENSDIVEKEMYTFRTKSGDSLSLRPEGTPSVVRAYLEHGMHVKSHPVKLYYMGQMFRHDQPQAGRYRQFYQLGAERIGDSAEIIDAELIFMAHKLLDSIGLDNYFVHINSIGDSQCRPSYLKALKEYYRTKIKKVCNTCKVRFKGNILRMIDCKEPECREIAKEIPQFVDYLDDECRAHFKHVLEFLDDVKVPYILDPTLVRGLDYYTRTVFEFVPEDVENSLSVLSGGRYDKLVNLLGGPKTPACGWAMGMERIVLAMREKNLNIPEIRPKPKVFLAQLGEVAKRKSLNLFESFRKAGIEAKSSLGRDSIKSQLRIAHRLGAKFTLIFGQKEAFDGTVILKEMETGVQETIPLEKIVDEVKKRLRN